MDLELTDEQGAVRRLAKDFVDREVAPHAAAWDRAERVDRAIVPKLGALGFLGLTIPARYGGSDGDHLSYALVTEELGRGDSAMRGILSVSLGLCAKSVAAWGSEAQKREWLPRLCAGEAVGCFGLTEPGTGSDAASLTTRAVRDGAGYVIDGTKTFITNGTWADVVLLFAGTGPELAPPANPGALARTVAALLADRPGASYSARRRGGTRANAMTYAAWWRTWRGCTRRSSASGPSRRLGSATHPAARCAACLPPAGRVPARSRATRTRRAGPWTARGGVRPPVARRRAERARGPGALVGRVMTTENVELSDTAGGLDRLTADRQPTAAVCAPRGGQGEPTARRRRAVAWRHLAPLALFAADGAATVGSLLLADADQAARAVLPALGVLAALNAHAGLYRPGLSTAALDELPSLLWHTVLTWCVVTTGLVALDRWGPLLALLAAHAPLLCAARAAAHLGLRRHRRRAPCPALVVGSGPVGERVLATLIAAPGYGLRPVGLVAAGLAPVPGDPLAAGAATTAPMTAGASAAVAIATGPLAAGALPGPGAGPLTDPEPPTGLGPGAARHPGPRSAPRSGSPRARLPGPRQGACQTPGRGPRCRCSPGTRTSAGPSPSTAYAPPSSPGPRGRTRRSRRCSDCCGSGGSPYGW